jgi:hypothetical protein
MLLPIQIAAGGLAIVLVRRDVLLAVAAPPPPHVAGARPIRVRLGRTSRELTTRIR